jgi:hypothetical protein
VLKLSSKSNSSKGSDKSKSSSSSTVAALSGDEFVLNSDHVTVDVAAPSTSAASSTRNKKASGTPRGIVYIGRLPHGFFEDQMKVNWLSCMSLQFIDTLVRLCSSPVCFLI